MKTIRKQKLERAASGGHRLLITDHRLLCLILLFLASGTGCRLLQTAANVPGQAVRAVTPGNKGQAGRRPGGGAANAVAVRRRILDAHGHRHRQTPARHQRAGPAEILQWKIALATETCSIASGPNAVANLLDMTVFVTVTRMALEDHWQPKVFGESALPCWKAAGTSETEIWRIAGSVLKPEQQTELRQRLRCGTGRIRCRKACWRRARWVSLRKSARPTRPMRPSPAVCSACSRLTRSPAWTRPCAKSPRRGCLPSALSS